jgi:hypothetical protein
MTFHVGSFLTASALIVGLFVLGSSRTMLQARREGRPQRLSLRGAVAAFAVTLVMLESFTAGFNVSGSWTLRAVLFGIGLAAMAVYAVIIWRLTRQVVHERRNRTDI